jgi:hypothetical protein
MASSPFPVYLHFHTKVTRLVLQVITAFGSQLVSVEHQVLENSNIIQALYIFLLLSSMRIYVGQS